MLLLDAPMLLCYDRSPGARHAIEHVGSMFPGARVLVLHVLGFPLESTGYRAGVESGTRGLDPTGAEEGREVARAAGLVSTPLSASGRSEGTWRTILRVADEHAVSLIVTGSRGLGGVRSLFLGSVSHGIVHHSRRPVMVVPAHVEAGGSAAGGADSGSWRLLSVAVGEHAGVTEAAQIGRPASR